MQVTPQPEDGTGDRRAPLPRTLGPPGRQIERFAARSRAAERVLDVDVPRVGAIQWPGPSSRSVVEHEAHAHAVVGLRRRVGEHRAGDETLAARERQAEEQARDRDRRCFLARRQQMHADGKEELPVLGIGQVEVM